MRVITEKNISDMLRLAEEVRNALDMSFSNYDDEGNNIFNLYYDEEHSEESTEKIKGILTERIEDDRQFMLLQLYDENWSLSEVIELSLSELKEKLEPIMHIAICLFRKGVDSFGVVVDDSVSDEYLTELFCMKVRDMLMIHAALQE